LLFSPKCLHCLAQKALIPYLQTQYPELSWVHDDTSRQKNVRLLANFIAKSARPDRSVGIPMTFIGAYVIDGFDTPATTGVQLEQAIRVLPANDPSLFPQANSDGGRQTINLPLTGTIRLTGYSLPALAVTIGLVDDFNPCAMWVLAHLISLTVSLNDRR